MSEHIQYKVISSQTEKALVIDVNRYISNGWQCQGSMVIQFPELNGILFYQAMVFPKPEAGEHRVSKWVSEIRNSE